MSGQQCAGWFVLQLGLSMLMALVVGPSALRRAAALGPVCVALVVPWVTAPTEPYQGFLLATGGLIPLMRYVDLARERRPSSPLVRVWFSVTPFDVRRVERLPPGVDLPVVAGLVAFVGLTAGAWWLVGLAETLDGPARLSLRWSAGLVFAYSIVESIVRTVRTGYRLGGIEIPPVHVHPALARSVQEFWARRWNRPVHEWLMAHCFMPLARRRHPRLGILAAFAASTAIHVWLAAVPLELDMVLSMGVFFVVQGPVVLIELELGVPRWRRPLQHAWAVVVLGGLSPLFVEPFLRVFGA